MVARFPVLAPTRKSGCSDLETPLLCAGSHTYHPFGHYNELVQAVSVAVHDSVHAGNLDFQFHWWQSKVEDAGVSSEK